MGIKHQADCYRVIGGVKYKNYSDLIMGEVENEKVIEEVKASGKKYRVISHWSKDYKQIFVEN